MTGILVLGGTNEAIEIAEFLAKNHRVTYSLAGKTATPALPKDCHVRCGGFGGLVGLVQHLQQEGYGLIVDATHPFAEIISANATKAARQCGIPYRQWVRGRWQAQAQDRWQSVSNFSTLVDLLDAHHTCALFTLGQRGLEPLQALRRTKGVFRMITPIATIDGDFLHPATSRHTILCQRPPYGFDFEDSLVNRYGCTCLVTRNAGGKRPAKLDVYAKRGLPVLMLDDRKAQNITQTLEKFLHALPQ